MTKQQAARVLVTFIQLRLNQATQEEQIRIYEALAVVLPTSAEKRQAKGIATAIRQLALIETEFSRQLFREIQWPGHQHNGRKGNH